MTADRTRPRHRVPDGDGLTRAVAVGRPHGVAEGALPPG